jgi:hypothetical protein
MKRTTSMGLSLLLAVAAGAAEEKPAPQKAAATVPPAAAKADAPKPGGDVAMSGMSILGNDEAPKSLVIVPWKSSQLGDTPGIARLLDDATQPVDREVFMRELSYYGIRTGSTVSRGSK